LWDLATQTVRRYGVATSGLRTLPDYLLIGTKRGGTTSLAYALLEHHQVIPMFPSATILPLHEHQKGVHYFDTGRAQGDRWYRSHFATRPYVATRRRIVGARVVTGEASPYYLYRPGASHHCRSLVPDARILVLLRDPVERAYSHYKEQRRRGFEPLDSFASAIEAEQSRLVGEVDRLLRDPKAVSFAHENQSYVSQGEYFSALAQWMAAYGDRVLVRFSEDFYADGPGVFDDVCGFLGIESRRSNALQHRNPTSNDELDPVIRRHLRDHYQESDERLEELLGLVPPWRR